MQSRNLDLMLDPLSQTVGHLDLLIQSNLIILINDHKDSMMILTWTKSPATHIGNIECLLCPQSLPCHPAQGVFQLQNLK